MAEDEGWGFPLKARKAHYFRKGRSLCGKWLFFSKFLDQDDTPHDADCVICRRKRGKELAK